MKLLRNMLAVVMLGLLVAPVAAGSKHNKAKDSSGHMEKKGICKRGKPAGKSGMRKSRGAKKATVTKTAE